VVEVHPDGESTSYTLYAHGIQRVLDATYPHEDLIPSPRGYPNIAELLGETRLTGKKMGSQASAFAWASPMNR